MVLVSKVASVYDESLVQGSLVVYAWPTDSSTSIEPHYSCDKPLSIKWAGTRYVAWSFARKPSLFAYVRLSNTVSDVVCLVYKPGGTHRSSLPQR